MRCPLARGNAPTDVVMPSLSSVILNALCRQSHRPVDLMTDLCDLVLHGKHTVPVDFGSRSGLVDKHAILSNNRKVMYPE